MTTGTGTSGGAGRPLATEPITISFAGFNRAWAAWIGHRLNLRGYQVSFQRWDPPVTESLETSFADLVLAPGKVLLILSDWYFQLGPRTVPEWNTALRNVVPPHRARFAAVSVASGALPTATTALAPSELTGIGEREAERRVLLALGLPTDRLPARVNATPGPRYPLDTPEVWGAVPRRNTRFTGRETLLNEAYHYLSEAGEGAGVLTLNGMSGVGKTQLAAEYVYRFGSEYDVVWWISAENRGTYRRGLAELSTALGLRTGDEYGERLRAALDALRRGDPYAKWLIVVDGADEPEEVWDLLPTGPGHVLISSRNTDWSQHNSRLLDVPVYARDESVAFIRRRAPRLDEAEADRLAEALGDMPLVLDQAAGWLNDSDISIEQYIALLEEGGDTSVVKVSADFPAAFQTAWSILLNRLRDTVPESIDLLRLCTYFAPGLIPVWFLRDLPAKGVPEQLVGLLNDPLRWNRAVNQLRQYSVVRLESHEGATEDAQSGESLYLHRMVHQIVHSDISAEEGVGLADTVRRALALADPGRPTDTRNWPRYAEIVPHLKYADVLHSTDADVQRLVLNCLRYMYLSGEYDAGRTFGQRALETWREVLGAEHPRVWDVTHHYANVLRTLGEYGPTERIERPAVEFLRRTKGEEDLDHLRAAGGLAADLRGLGRFEEAKELSVWLADTYRELVGPEDSRYLSAQNNVAASLRLLGDYEGALAIDRRILEDRRRLLARRHPWTLFSEISYATDLRLLGRNEEACSNLEMSVRENQLVMGSDHPQTLRAEFGLAMGRYRQGQRQEAGIALASVVERCERVIGGRHPTTLLFLASLSSFLREHGDIDEARRTGERVDLSYRRTLGDAHPYTAGVRGNLALILRNLGEREQALEMSEEALVTMERAVGAWHPWSLGCAVNTAAIRNVLGDVESAERLTAKTAVQAAESLGRTHPLTLSARIAHAADLRALRKREAADKEESAALDDLAQTLGPQHVHTVSARSRQRPFWDFEPQTT
ncbi:MULTISPECIES: FxSxx-COOH system tetratricopeptide repeat protein [Streptomyces]|uniref:FxSxx-COOH system tetratricopeptide repeat protein n=1 Tax=Streptomyces evansiae TaxID=3075535 RepID=A0ABU2RC68_9ACTN|nr:MULTISPECIES: FxSxx-COOH system tetratricopeptide repeat protein [unclassified Streptomyces]MDT0413345.1 FxSxx-COOH system tetratricopeptide repeat protein [Streptomyces sp. DSM 41979]MDT0424603.1 FxSxx-COOH system tetratricopeptide repeat protein [Streptomyces sp. DSM 41859]MYQ61898.1 tetratricopeptide repeat protein [Streptomyces sp. SID4926]WEH29780.1 FxSxx-COOH system tetratricopeptide repeat protein [Streptomyces sp. AM 3-1-1]SCE59092.1 Tetratricopeptide (TPR) repeat [Streptomyces sp. 